MRVYEQRPIELRLGPVLKWIFTESLRINKNTEYQRRYSNKGLRQSYLDQKY